MRGLRLGLVAFVLNLLACSGVEATSTTDAMDGPVAGAGHHLHEEHPPPDVVIEVDGATTLEVYDLGARVLVSVHGKAEGTPGLGRLRQYVKANRLVELHRLLQPKHPVPEKLYEIEERLSKDGEKPSASRLRRAEHPQADSSNAEVKVSAASLATSTAPLIDMDGEDTWRSAEPSSGHSKSGYGRSGGQPANVTTMTWCGNLCCDGNWVYHNICSHHGDMTWHNVDYGYSYAYGYDLSRYDTVVCQSGPWGSFFEMRMEGGYYGAWAVAQGPPRRRHRHVRGRSRL